MSTIVHMCLDVRGAIQNRSFDGFVKDDGTPATRTEALNFLLDHVAQGHRVIPLVDTCEGFSYEDGCPGHDVPEKPAGGEG